MKTMHVRMGWVLLAVALVLPAARGEAAENGGGALRRFALLAAANDGGPGRVRLRYAHSDAEAVAEVLGAMGGVREGDRVLVLDPDAEALSAAFDALAARVAEARAQGERTEVVFYYSGHSDEQGLLISGDHVPYREVRAALGGVGADVRIGILDSCASGALTRGKGGVRQPPFLLDAASAVTGYAFLTSASETEAAQESDRLAASFFTHYLVSGLRGAADATPDGRVTLTEAYQYAFHETLARTESTRGGAQHPAYDMHLVGSGDVVLTDLRDTSATVELAAASEGRLFVRDRGGRLVAEVRKPAGRPMRLGLAPGQYQVTWEGREGLRRGTLVLTDGAVMPVEPATLDPVGREEALARGDAAVPARGPTADGYQTVPATFAVVPGVTSDSVYDRPTRSFFRLDLLGGRGGALLGLEVAGLWAELSGPAEGLQVSGAAAFAERVAGLQVAGLLGRSRGRVDGLQYTGLLALAGGPLVGLQGAGLYAEAREVVGLQTAGLGVRSGETVGLQAAGVYAEAGAFTGLQSAGLLARARHLRGLQTSVVNAAAGSMAGAQVGVVNVAGKARGLQIGVVNVADELDGFALGLVNVIRGGILAPTVWSSEHALANVALRSGTRRAYVLFGAATHPGEDGAELRPLLGLGVRFGGEPLWLDLDVVSTSNDVLGDADYRDTTRGLDQIVSLRLPVGWRVAGRFGIYAGPTLNLLVTRGQQDRAPSFSMWQVTSGDVDLALWPGLTAGIEL